ncbi:MAG: hypothetical protein NHB15_03185 [Methanosarcina barkeri]|nr:hypothetical protein [Methanosarcina sp. ERenArc_MAG2]
MANADNCIFVVNLNEKDTDKIGYWEIGNAYAKKLKIIGYHTSKYNMFSVELERLVELKSRDTLHFIKIISSILEKRGYYIPNIHYFLNNSAS